MAQVKEANGNKLGNFFDLVYTCNNCMLSVLIRIASMRRF